MSGTTVLNLLIFFILQLVLNLMLSFMIPEDLSGFPVLVILLSFVLGNVAPWIALNIYEDTNIVEINFPIKEKDHEE